MKRLLPIQRFFAAVLLLVFSTLSWANGTKINGIYYVLDSSTKTASVTYTGTTSSHNPSSIAYTGSITIPSTVKYNSTTYSVTRIDNYAFYYCSGLTSITIPNSVTSIGDFAFQYCRGLTSVTIGNSVTSIGDDAFAYCSSLTSITIPNSVTSIGKEAFEDCSGLKSITIPNSVASIGEKAFRYCSGLTSVTIPNSVTSIGIFAFYNCSGLTSVTIGNSVTSIGSWAFEGCSGMTSITIGNSVTSIGASAFRGCSSLTKAEYASIESLCKIYFGSSESNPLYNAKHLYINGQEITDLVIPNSVTSIGNYAFNNCSALTSVTIPNSVTSIGYYAFASCSRLKEVSCLARQVPSTDSDAFNNTNIASATLYVRESAIDNYKSTAPWRAFGTFKALDDFDFVADGIYYNINSDGASVTVTYKTTSYNSYSGSLVIPATVTYNGKQYSVTSIDNSAFRDCSGLKSITIPTSVTSIGDDAFSGCSGLTSIVVDKDNTYFDSRDNCNAIIQTSSNTLISGCKNTVIPNSVTSISEYAFRNYSGLTSVTIPESVTSIGNNAFYNCTGLTSVTINSNAIVSKTYTSSSNLKTIFGSQVKEYIIGDAITSIGSYAFYGCSGLTSITIPESVTNISDYAFNGCSGLTKAEFASIESLCKIAFGNGSANPLYYAKHLYINGQEVTDLVIPNTVTSIGYLAFISCSSLTSVTIPNSVTSIGKEAFDFCSGLTSVNIPSSVTSIGNYAFNGCSGLTSIVVDKDNTYYDSRDNCNAIIQTSSNTMISGCKSTVIPNSVTSIGVGAFSRCSGLTSVIIPESVKSIGAYAFQYCTGLKEVSCMAETVPTTSSNAFNNTSIASAILCVPASAINDYKSTAPWSSFGTFVELNYDFMADGLYYSINADGTSVSVAYYSNQDGNSYSGSVVIPATVTHNGKQYTVANISEYAFRNYSGLTSVTIPESVTSIGNNAFYNCTGLTSVTINSNAIVSKTYTSSSNLKTIFGSQVKEYIIGDAITSIGSYAFYGCSGLTSITIPNSVKSIGYSALNNCSGLKSITIPESVTSIGELAFRYCYGLTSITIPSSVTSIGSSAFYGCSGLTSITIPNSVTEIGENAFRGCSGLTSIVVDKDNTYYDSRDNCNAIIQTSSNTLISGCNNTVIPESVTSIGSYAFSGCSGLTSITIPNSVKSIGRYAFSGCSSLTSITIPNSVTSIGNYAFEDCSGLKGVYCMAKQVPSTKSDAFNNTNIASATLYVHPSAVDAYKSTAPWNGFGTIALERVYDFEANGICYYVNPNETSVTITYRTTDYNSYSGSVVIPSTVNYSGKQYSVTGIGKAAFRNCSGLKSITIPSSVTSIGEEAFIACSGLTSVTINSNKLVSKTYTSSSNLKTIFGTQVQKYILGDDVTSIGNYAFYYCSGLTSVTIPNSVTSIGSYSFYRCSSLASITIPNSVTSIGDEAFPSSCKIYIDKSAYALETLWDNGISPYDKTTKALLAIPSASMTNSASSIRLTGTTYSGGMEMTSQSYTVSGTTKTGNSASFTGLTPGTSYPVAYKATVRYGGNTLTYTRNYSMSTSELTLTTSQPKVISAGNVIVEATSNLDDEEENAGFEWRRTDWTADFSSNTGAAYLYEGTMEGYIRNLYTEKLWKVRPYYRDNNGTYYYGEWVGLDPTNTSYFEPTVHTYAKISVTGNKASLSGYVQRGSDNVSKQGFKYWADASGARGAGITIPTSAKTVEAEGRIMEAELTGLLPNTTYSYVAFVTTTEGETFYGKQLTFTTEDDPDAAVLGDANGNGVVEIGDVTSVLTLMATPEATGYDNKAADANKNGVIEIGDVTTILTIMAGGN